MDFHLQQELRKWENVLRKNDKNRIEKFIEKESNKKLRPLKLILTGNK